MDPTALVMDQYPASLFLPQDAYDLSTRQVLGRRVAGAQLAQSFARDLQEGEMLTVFSPGDRSGETIKKLLSNVIPTAAKVRLCDQFRPDLLAEVGALYVPDPLIGRWTPLRQSADPWSFSLAGVIHTVCSEGSLGGLANIPLAPLYPWDAVVCTSRAGRDVVAKAFEHRVDVMASRLNVPKPDRETLRLPQLPIIPLPIDSSQPYQPQLTREARRKHARQALQIDADSFVVAFIGRLSFHSKCHPSSLYRALDALALESASREVVLIECGHIFNSWIADSYDQLRTAFPRVNFRLVGGLTPATDDEKWQVLAAADVFTSPSDNLQETFGLSLLEAMVAELPLVVSDWSGYRDLVDDGRNGFLISTCDVFKHQSESDDIDSRYFLGDIDYDSMIGVRSLGVVVDHGSYLDSFRILMMNPDRCTAMARESLDRVRRFYSAQVVAASYRRLWEQLAELRSKAALEAASSTRSLPEFAPAYGSIFDHYSSSGYGELRDICIRPTRQTKEQFESPMNQALLDQALSGRLSDIHVWIDRRESFTFDFLKEQGFSDVQALRAMAALLKLGLSDAS